MENSKKSYIFKKKARPLTYTELKEKNIPTALPQFNKDKDTKYKKLNDENFFKMLEEVETKFDDVNVAGSHYGLKELVELLGYINQAIDYKIDITPHDDAKLMLLESMSVMVIALYEKFAILIGNKSSHNENIKKLIKKIMLTNDIPKHIKEKLTEQEKIFCNTFLKIKVKAESDVK